MMLLTEGVFQPPVVGINLVSSQFTLGFGAF
jgi:hypothetical protein